MKGERMKQQGRRGNTKSSKEEGGGEEKTNCGVINCNGV